MDLGQLWNVGLVIPLEEALKFFTNALWGNYGLAIIVFTLVIKFILMPLTVQQIRSSKAMMELQPKLQALQKKHGKDREKLMQEQMQLYKEHKVNPAAGCLPMLVQMPIWFALYQALRALAGSNAFPQAQQGFLWIANLANPEGTPWSHPVGWPILAVATGITQWVTQRMMAPRSTDPQQQMMNQMMQFMPLMFVYFAFNVPAGLVLYWVTSNLFMFAQQYFTTGWGSLSLPAPVASLLGVKMGQPDANKLVNGPVDGVVANVPSSNGSKPASVEREQEAIAQAKDQTGNKRRRNKRR